MAWMCRWQVTHELKHLMHLYFPELPYPALHAAQNWPLKPLVHLHARPEADRGRECLCCWASSSHMMAQYCALT